MLELWGMLKVMSTYTEQRQGMLTGYQPYRSLIYPIK